MYPTPMRSLEFQWSCWLGQTSKHRRVWPTLESLEDLSITHFGSLNGAHNNDALCFTEGVVASTDRSKMVRLIGRTAAWGWPFLLNKGATPTCWYLDHFGPGIHQPEAYFGTCQSVELVCGVNPAHQDAWTRVPELSPSQCQCLHQSNGVWLAQEELRVCSGHSVGMCGGSEEF